MTRTPKRLSRPLYEGLPWIYMAGGAGALFVSYVSPYRAIALIMGLTGVVGVLAGVVVLLRRRDFRKMKAEYGNPDRSLNDLGDE